MTAAPQPKTTSLASWFGSNRTFAPRVGVELGRRNWVGVGFMGGGSELLHINTRAGVACDKHRHVINLARVIRDRRLRRELVRRLLLTPFHADELAGAQRRCVDREQTEAGSMFAAAVDTGCAADLDWAFDYFVCSWMARSANAGKKGEFRGGLATRYNAGGGASGVRFRSAAESVEVWGSEVLGRWEFITDDAFEFADRILAGNPSEDDGSYWDPPWVEEGKDYKHRFSIDDHRRLASVLGEMAPRRVVVRYGDHPLIRELYPAPRWTWIKQTSRDQGNGDVAEVLILNGESYAAH